MNFLRIWARRITMATAIMSAASTLLLRSLWDDRPDLRHIDWQPIEPAPTIASDLVTVTWLGVSTLLFDDGETQLLIDGFFSRPSLAETVLGHPVDNDAATINFAMNEFRMRRLAAIIPVHSHFDHAMDVGAVANRSRASVLGSESTAQIARGAGVPDDQIIVASADQEYAFGQFTVTLIPSPHAPFGWRGSVPLDGTIDDALVMPQPISAFRMGGAWSILIEHPDGTTLVQGSSGFRKYALRDRDVDVVFLGIGMLDAIDREYAELYWQHMVTATGADTVYPVHFDDYTQPFGQIVPPPRVVSNIVTICRWLEQFRDRWDADVSLHLPEFGKPIAVYASAAAET